MSMITQRQVCEIQQNSALSKQLKIEKQNSFKQLINRMKEILKKFIDKMKNFFLINKTIKFVKKLIMERYIAKIQNNIKKISCPHIFGILDYKTAVYCIELEKNQDTKLLMKQIENYLKTIDQNNQNMEMPMIDYNKNSLEIDKKGQDNSFFRNNQKIFERKQEDIYLIDSLQYNISVERDQKANKLYTVLITTNKLPPLKGECPEEIKECFLNFAINVKNDFGIEPKKTRLDY